MDIISLFNPKYSDNLKIRSKILSCLDITDMLKLEQTCKTVREIVNQHIVDLIIEGIDELISQGDIIEAEKHLRNIFDSQKRQTSTKLINRYLLILHADIWSNSKYHNLRFEIFEYFKNCVLDLHGPTKRTFGYPQLINNGKVENYPRHDYQNYELSPKQIAKITNFISASSGKVETQSDWDTELIIFAYFLFKCGNVDGLKKILNYIENSTKTDNYYFKYWLKGIMHFYADGYFYKAVNCLIRTIELNPNFAYGYYTLGCFLHNSANNEFAHKLYEKTIEIDPKHHYAMLNLNLQSPVDNRLIVYKNIIDIHPTEVSAYINYSSALRERGDFTQEENNKLKILFTSAIKNNPKNCPLWIEFANILCFNFKDYKRAHHVLKKKVLLFLEDEVMSEKVHSQLKILQDIIGRL